jgi:hypothetical protein
MSVTKELKIDYQLIEDHKEVKEEKRNLSEELEKLRDRFVKTEKVLDDTRERSHKLDEEQEGGSFLTIPEVEKAKKARAKIAEEVDTAESVCANLTTAINGATSTIQSLTKREMTAMQKIWTAYSKEAIYELKEIGGELVDRYLASILRAYPELTPHVLPQDFTDILKNPSRLSGLQSEIESEIFDAEED